MTGAWARACDAWERACDAWEDVSPAPETAVLLISQTLWNNRYRAVNGVPASELLVKDIELAGACIRAWRKSLSAQSERWPDVSNIPTERLLWVALHDVGRASYWAPQDPSMAADFLRSAEVLLRTWWKRSQP